MKGLQIMHWIALHTWPEAPSQGAVQAWPPDGTGSDASLCPLAWWALRFTPKVACLIDAVVLEVSTSARLWGGSEALQQQLAQVPEPLAAVRLASGETSLLALGRLRVGGASDVPADALPLTVLDAAAPHLDTLARLGCTRWGQLRALPRAGLARRFGAGLLQALDQAYGVVPEVYPWLRLPEVFEARMELPSAVEDASALLFGARRLLLQLQAWLAARQRALLGLELRWFMDERRGVMRQGAVVLRVAVPASDTAHLQTLLAERLAQQTLEAPALALQLRSLETVVLSGCSASWLPDAHAQGDSVLQMVERLSARLGPAQVLRWQARADHRPQCMQVWQPALQEGKVVHTPATLPGALWPTWLLPEPQALRCRQGLPHYHGRLHLLLGPQRIESAWWDSAPSAQGGPVRRDYFVAHSARCGLLWVYQDAAQASAGGVAPWYLHGFFA
jgi:protein ImuB